MFWPIFWVLQEWMGHRWVGELADFLLDNKPGKKKTDVDVLFHIPRKPSTSNGRTHQDDSSRGGVCSVARKQQSRTWMFPGGVHCYSPVRLKMLCWQIGFLVIPENIRTVQHEDPAIKEVVTKELKINDPQWERKELWGDGRDDYCTSGINWRWMLEYSKP